MKVRNFMSKKISLELASSKDGDFKAIFSKYNDNFTEIEDVLNSSDRRYVVDTFTSTEGQSTFILSDTYVPTSNSLSIWVSGIYQTVGIAYKETSTNSFSFLENLPAGLVITARYERTRKFQKEE